MVSGGARLMPENQSVADPDGGQRLKVLQTEGSWIGAASETV